MARNLEGITKDYWGISHALRSPHTARVVSAQDAFKALKSADYLRPDQDWRLIDLMHVIRFDIIEANTEWRETIKVYGNVLNFTPVKMMQQAAGNGKDISVPTGMGRSGVDVGQRSRTEPVG